MNLISDVKYGSHQRQCMDLYLPLGEKSPVLVFIHGGAWSSGEKESYRDLGRFYTYNGLTVVVVNHRISPSVKHPSHLEDVYDSYNWVKKNISNYGSDQNNIFLMGHSSGAHLASLLVCKHQDIDPKGVILMSGVYSIGDNLDLAGYGHVFPKKADRYEASAVNFVHKNLPPFFLLYGENDMLTIDLQAINFHNILDKKGVRSCLHCIENENHTTVLLDCVTPHRSGKMILDFIERNKK